MALLTLTLAGCHKEDTHIDVNKSQVLGTWVKVGTQEYWRYQSGGSGATWDESEDIGGDETNLTFSWTLDGSNIASPDGMATRMLQRPTISPRFRKRR